MKKIVNYLKQNDMRIAFILLCILTYFMIVLIANAQMNVIPYDSAKVIPEEVCQECLIGNQVPPWVTIDPQDPMKELWRGEVVDISLNKGKAGTTDTCQYQVRSRKDPNRTWTCAGLSNSERKRRQ